MMTLKRKLRSDKFPLTLHPTGQYCKKIKGKIYYFGSNRTEALKKYLDRATILHGGSNNLNISTGDNVTLKQLCDMYLSYQYSKLQTGLDEGIEDGVIEPMENLIDSLCKLQFNPGHEPFVIHFSEVGIAAFKEVIIDHQMQFERYGLDECLAAHWAKMEGYLARIALIIHLVRFHSGETSSTETEPESVYMAATLINYFKANIARFCRKIDNNHAFTTAERIINWSYRHNKNSISVRDIITARIVQNREGAVNLPF